MRPLLDHAPAYSTRRLRRRHIAKRVLGIFTVGLCVWSAWALVTSVTDFNDRRGVELERAAQLGKGTR